MVFVSASAGGHLYVGASALNVSRWQSGAILDDYGNDGGDGIAGGTSFSGNGSSSMRGGSSGSSSGSSSAADTSGQGGTVHSTLLKSVGAGSNPHISMQDSTTLQWARATDASDVVSVLVLHLLSNLTARGRLSRKVLLLKMLGLTLPWQHQGSLRGNALTSLKRLMSTPAEPQVR